METSITIPNILIQMIFPPLFQDIPVSPKDLKMAKLLIWLSLIFEFLNPFGLSWSIPYREEGYFFHSFYLCLSFPLFLLLPPFPSLSHYTHACSQSRAFSPVPAGTPSAITTYYVITNHLQFSGSLSPYTLLTLLLPSGTSNLSSFHMECLYIFQTTCLAGSFPRHPHLLQYQLRLHLLPLQSSWVPCTYLFLCLPCWI